MIEGRPYITIQWTREPSLYHEQDIYIKLQENYEQSGDNLDVDLLSISFVTIAYEILYHRISGLVGKRNRFRPIYLSWAERQNPGFSNTRVSELSYLGFGVTPFSLEHQNLILSSSHPFAAPASDEKPKTLLTLQLSPQIFLTFVTRSLFSFSKFRTLLANLQSLSHRIASLSPEGLLNCFARKWRPPLPPVWFVTLTP